MLAVQYGPKSGIAYFDTGNTHHQQSQCMMTKHDDQQKQVMNEAMDPGPPIEYPSKLHVPSNDITTRFPSCNKKVVMTKYRAMMHGPIYQAFKRAAAGELYHSTDLASMKLPILEKALQQAMKGHVKDKLIDRWTVCSSNVFGGQPEISTVSKEGSPVMITLNCSPVDDGSICCHAPGIPLWTPDYLQAIIEVLREEDLWPKQVTPLCVEYRSCCPLLVALSIPGAPESLDMVNEGGLGPSSMLGWHCGSYAETHTSKEDRALFGSYSSVVHGAATASWLRILHAKGPATLGSKDFIANDPAVALREFTPISEHESNIWVSNMGLDGTPCDTKHFNKDDFHLGQHPTGKRHAVYFDAVHPGRDIYLYGAALQRNVRTWFTVGKLILSDLSKEIAELDEGKEQGLSAFMAERVLEAGEKISNELSTDYLETLVTAVVGKLVAKGHGHVLERGPHAHEVHKFLCSPCTTTDTCTDTKETKIINH